MSVESGHRTGTASAGPFRHPNESAKNRLVYRTFEAALRDAGERYARGRMIDVGGGRQAVAACVRPYVPSTCASTTSRRSGVRGPTVDVVATAVLIPLPGGGRRRCS